MKINNQTQIKRTKDLAITAQLVDVLREVNLNASWKNGSTKFSKNRTGYMKGDTKFSNLMTEQDLDKLFNRSK